MLRITLTDMGLGKTFIGSEKMIDLKNPINLIICQKSKINDWINHFKQFYNLPVFDLTKSKEYEKFFNKSNNVIGIINYELCWRRNDLLNLKNFTLMLDESSLIQNEKAKQSKFCLKLKPNNVILLSGTPTSGRYERLLSQANLLGWKISKDLYDKQYVNYKKMYIGTQYIRIVNKDNPYKNVERLINKFKEHGAIFMKTEECYNLPAQNFINLKVENTNEYKYFEKNKIIKTKNYELVGDTTLTKILYLRQLASTFNKNKYEVFKDLINSTNERIIVFYQFTKELEELKKLIEKPISEVNGSKKDLTNYENENDSITFVQYQSGSKGLNLQKANKIIYFTPTLSVEDWMQSQKRIHRLGQEKTCFYYKLITKNSIEEKIYKALERGVDYTNKLFEEENNEK